MNVLEGTRSVWKLPEEGWTRVEHSGRWSLEGWLGLLPTLYKEGAFHCWGGTILLIKYLPITF